MSAAPPQAPIPGQTGPSPAASNSVPTLAAGGPAGATNGPSPAKALVPAAINGQLNTNGNANMNGTGTGNGQPTMQVPFPNNGGGGSGSGSGIADGVANGSNPTTNISTANGQANTSTDAASMLVQHPQPQQLQIIYDRHHHSHLSEQERQLPMEAQKVILWKRFVQIQAKKRQQSLQKQNMQAPGQSPGTGQPAGQAQAHVQGQVQSQGQGQVQGQNQIQAGAGAQNGQMQQGLGQMQGQMQAQGAGQGQGGVPMQQQSSQQQQQQQQMPMQMQGQGQGQGQLPGQGGPMGQMMARQGSTQQQPLQPPPPKVPSPLAQGQMPQTPRMQQSPSMVMKQGNMMDMNGQFPQQPFPQGANFPNQVPNQAQVPGPTPPTNPKMAKAMEAHQQRLQKQAAQAAQLSKSPQQPPPQLAGSPIVGQFAAHIGRSPALQARGQMLPHMTPGTGNMQLPQDQHQQQQQQQQQQVAQGQMQQMNMPRQQQQQGNVPAEAQGTSSPGPQQQVMTMNHGILALWEKRRIGTITPEEDLMLENLLKNQTVREFVKQHEMAQKKEMIQQMALNNPSFNINQPALQQHLGNLGPAHAQALSNLPPAQAQAWLARMALQQQQQQQMQQQGQAQGHGQGGQGNQGLQPFQQGMAPMGNLQMPQGAQGQGQGLGQGQGQMPHLQAQQAQQRTGQGQAQQRSLGNNQQQMTDQAHRLQLAQAQKTGQMPPNTHASAQLLLQQQQKMRQATDLAQQIQSIQQSQQLGNFQGQQAGRVPQGVQMMQQGQQPDQTQRRPALAEQYNPAAQSKIQAFDQMSDQAKAELEASRPHDFRQLSLASMTLKSGQPHQQGQQQNGLTPGGSQRLPQQFAMGGQAAQNVSNNLHIPVGRHRNSIIASQQGPQGPGTPQSNGAGPAGSPMRMPHMNINSGNSNAGTPPPHQNPLVRNLLNAGIPTVPNRATVPISQQIDMTRLKPEQFASINGLDPNAVRRASLDRRMSTGAAPTQLMPPNASEESGAVPKATWEPDAEYDAKLLARLLEPTKPERSSGRATFGRLGIPRIMENVPMEVVPEALKALLEEKDDPSKAAVDPALPGRNKRRFQELADTVDSELIIEHDVETVLLEIANEHADLVSQLACNLAKHRGSDQVDRKDVQLAYGFSSDQIRLDQAKSSSGKRVVNNVMRSTKLRLVGDAKAAWRREKEEERRKAEEAAAQGPAEGMSDMAGRIGVAA